MKSELLMTGFLTQKTSPEQIRQLLLFLENEIPNSAGYVRLPIAGSGSITVYAQAPEWLLWLAATSSIINIVQAILKMYQYITKSSEADKKQPRLIIQLKNVSEQSSQIIIDANTDEQILIEQVSTSIESISSDDSGIDLCKKVEESRQWIRIDKTK